MTTAVFVHGVPDTRHVWDDVLAHLPAVDADVLDLPGLGVPRPDGFGATKEEYVEVIIRHLETFREPVDLVGHDWGCILVARVASLRPDLLRTWAAGSGPVDAGYEWHEWAAIWQTPDEGEKWMADLEPTTFAESLQSFDAPPARARESAERIDDVMKSSILDLYRSAVTVGAEWEPDLAEVTTPGLVFWGRKDPAVPVHWAYRLRDATTAERVVVLDANHWTILERPAEVAAALREHWQR